MNKNELKSFFKISKEIIEHDSGHCYTAPLPLERKLGQLDSLVYSFSSSDGTEDPQASSVVVLEGDRPLEPGHASHDVIRQTGRGAYSHWDGLLYFSTSDNSDPRSGSNSYSVAVHKESVAPYSDLPTTIHMNLTSLCNLQCRICRPEGFKYTPDYLPPEVQKKIIDEIFPTLKELRLDSSGELFLSKDLPYVLKEASKLDIFTFICTNGMHFHEKNVEMICNSSIKKIQISLDSADKETLEWIRLRSKFDQIIEGTKRLVKRRDEINPDLHLSFHSALIKQNVNHVSDTIRLAAELGIDEVTTFFGFIHSYMDPDWSVFWDQDEYDESMQKGKDVAKEVGISFNPNPLKFKQDNKSKPPFYCEYLHNKSYVYPNGNIHPCCIGIKNMGSLLDLSFREIWHGEEYQQLRKDYNTDNPTWDKCGTCYVNTSFDPTDYKSLFAPEHYPYIEGRIGLTNEKPPKRIMKWSDEKTASPSDQSIEEIVKMVDEDS